MNENGRIESRGAHRNQSERRFEYNRVVGNIVRNAASHQSRPIPRTSSGHLASISHGVSSARNPFATGCRVKNLPRTKTGEQTQRNCLGDLQRRGVETFSERQWSESFIFVKGFWGFFFFLFYVQRLSNRSGIWKFCIHIRSDFQRLILCNCWFIM